MMQHYWQERSKPSTVKHYFSLHLNLADFPVNFIKQYVSFLLVSVPFSFIFIIKSTLLKRKTVLQDNSNNSYNANNC